MNTQEHFRKLMMGRAPDFIIPNRKAAMKLARRLAAFDAEPVREGFHRPGSMKK
jgi:hypothetical protein